MLTEDEARRMAAIERETVGVPNVEGANPKVGTKKPESVF
jgi:hypothetical protein